MTKTRTSGIVWTKKLAPPEGAAAAARSDVMVMGVEILFFEGAPGEPERRKWRAAYHAAGRLAKRCASH